MLRVLRVLILLFSVLVSLGLVVAANADPPDPTWIPGCWDDGDEDDAIVEILTIPGWVVPSDPVLVTVLVTYPFVPAGKRSEIITVAGAPVASRAPPLSLPLG
jgi:hypothetical protein